MREAVAQRVQAPALRTWSLRALLARDEILRTSLAALIGSRLLVWGAGCLAFLALGAAPGAVHAFDPARVSLSFGGVGNVLAAPGVRWDSIWYLQIAHDGYRTAREASFYPLYPILLRAGSAVIGSPVIAGLLISWISLLVGLVVMGRLTELELGAQPARMSIVLMTLGPMALFLSALYTESLFLALSVGTFYAARKDLWALAGMLGGLAALTRVTGVLLFIPVVIMFLYGPRSGVEPRSKRARLSPRFPVTPAILWAGLIPLGAAVFAAYLAGKGFGATGTIHAQEKFSAHHLVGPLVGFWDGLTAAVRNLRLELSGVPPSTYSSQAVLQFGALILALAAMVGTFRRLPPAYGAYVAIGILVPLSSPTIGDPLRGLDRYTSVLFPLFMWAGAWMAEQRGARRPVIALSVLLMLFFSAQFATWHWVGTPIL